MIENKTYTT